MVGGIASSGPNPLVDIGWRYVISIWHATTHTRTLEGVKVGGMRSGMWVGKSNHTDPCLTHHLGAILYYTNNHM